MKSTWNKPVAAACAAFAATTVAVAQQAPDNDGEELTEVVVTGYRASLQSSLEVKKNSELVVDAVSGGDIGALPDVTIAESLVRLPGINGTRDRGNVSQAVVRGLGPRLVLGLVNGREVASSEPSRNVRWEIYPSEVVSGADVYKSQSADLVAGGVAGTIDIRTIRPFDYSGPKALFRGGPVYYEAGSDIPGYDPYGYRGSGSYTDTPSDNFGFNIGVSVQQQKNAFPSFQGWGYNDGTINPGNLTGDIDDDGTDDPSPWGAQTEVKKLTEDRYGVNGALAFRVGDNFELNFDALYSKFTIDEDQNQAWYSRNGVMGNWDDGTSWCYERPASSYNQVAAPIIGRHARQLLRLGHQCHRAIHRGQGPVRHRREHQDRSHLDDERRPVLLEGHARESLGGIPLRDLSGDDDLGHVRQRHAVAVHQHQSRRREWPVGAALAHRHGRRSGRSQGQSHRAAAWISSASSRAITSRASSSARVSPIARRTTCTGTRTTRRSSRARCRRRCSPTTASPSSTRHHCSMATTTKSSTSCMAACPSTTTPSCRAPPGTSKKTSLEAYGLVRFAGSLGSVPFSANAGVRFVQTRTSSGGYGSTNGGTLEPLDISNEYTEPLPSVNFTFNLTEDKLLRVGLARVIARPPLDELRASRSLWNETPPPTGSGGNPLLDPFIANQADVSYEWYFAPEALAAIAVFYKDVDTHIGYNTQPVTIDGTTYAVTGPFNGEGGGIAGAELTFQTPFAQSGVMRNFGVYMNYAYVDTDVKEFYPVTESVAGGRLCRKHRDTGSVVRQFERGVAPRVQVPQPLQHHRGLERRGCPHAGRGNHPRLQRVVADERHVRRPAAGQQPHQRTAAHHA